MSDIEERIKKRTCSRCSTTVETFSEIVYSQGDRVCLDCKKETLEDDKRAFDRDMNLRRF